MLFIKCNTIYKAIDFIAALFLKLYELLLKISYILNSDIRRDIFIGITGLTVAIIIFIAEVISSKEYELEKRVILSKTNIINNMKFCIFIYFIMFLSSIVKSTYDSPNEIIYIQSDALYIILQLTINVLILVFMYKTFNLFKISVKLNIDKEYFNKELDSYVNKRSVEIEKEASKKSLKNIKKLKQDFENYLENRNSLSNDSLGVGFSEEVYAPIYTNKRGIIKNYNYKTIDTIIESIDNVSIEETMDYHPNNEPIFVFTRQIGDKVEKNSIVGYCLKNYKKYFKDFSNCIVYDENSMYIGDEIKLINENLLELANDFSEPNDFDDNNKLFNYFNYLYQNDLNGVRKFSIYQLEETARLVYKDKYKNNKYAVFLNSISSLAFSNDNYDEYHQISRLIFFLYYQQLKIDGNDIKKVAYNFANHYFKYDYFSIKKNSDIRFYDELMANLLRFICVLIREKKFDVISILFKNVLLEHDMHINDDFEEKDILNLQFATGIIQCLMMLIDKKETSEEDKKETSEEDKKETSEEDKKAITNIIHWTKQYFINTYDAWQIIINFKKYYYKKSSIQDVYDHLEFDFIDHEYLSSWSSWHIDEKIILKELLCAFKIRTVFNDSINYDEITKDDKYYYKSLLEMISSTEQTKFEKVLNINNSNNNSNLIESLKLAISDSEKKEEEYIKNHQLDNKKMNNFEKIIKEEAIKNNELEDYLNKLNKIEYIDFKIKRVCGTNQLIPRDIFFEDYGGYEIIAEQLGGIFKPAKEKEFIKIIDSISKTVENNLNDIIKATNNIEDYLLITNYTNYDLINGYDGYSDFVLIDEKKLEIIKFPQIRSIYLIEKKDLPKLQYCKFNEELNQDNIDGNLYYEINDCSKDENLRNEIIEKSSWLSEKGSIENQNEYLKKQCVLKIFMAFKFHKVKNSKSLKFIIKE